MTLEDVRDAFAAVEGVSLIEYHQAPGIGSHHFTFSCNESTLARLCKRLQETPYLDCNIIVRYEEGLVYKLRKGNAHMESFVEALKSLHRVRE